MDIQGPPSQVVDIPHNDVVYLHYGSVTGEELSHVELQGNKVVGYKNHPASPLRVG